MLQFRMWTVGTLVALAASGCASSKDARFYVLTARAAVASKPAAEFDGGIAVGPIEMPPYLNRPQIVTRGDGPQLSLAGFDRWAEPLEHSFSRVVTDNLSALLGTERVVADPWRGKTPPAYRVTMRVVRFDGTLNGDVLLSARWAVVGQGGRPVVELRRSSISVPCASPDYPAFAEAMSVAIVQLCEEIATALTASQGG